MYKFCKTEQSVRRQRELEQGLLAMMEHHRFEEISVSDLCDRLNIPRKSFYRYFTSKDGALHALLDHTLLEFYDTGRIEGLRGGTPIGDLERFFTFWKDHKRLLDAVKYSSLGGMLVERAVSLAKQEELMPMYNGLKLEIGNIPKDFAPVDSERGLRMDEYLKKHNL